MTFMFSCICRFASRYASVYVRKDTNAMFIFVALIPSRSRSWRHASTITPQMFVNTTILQLKLVTIQTLDGGEYEMRCTFESGCFILNKRLCILFKFMKIDLLNVIDTRYNGYIE